MSEFGFLNLGYNKEGYNKKGFDRQGYDREGYNKFGFNKEGFNRKGFDKFGYDRTGFDEQGYNVSGFDRNGYDKQGFDVNGYDKFGRDKKGYDKKGFDINGFNCYGFDTFGYDRQGFDKNGFNKYGFDREGFDKNGFNVNGYNRLGYDRLGYDHEGYDKFGFNKNGYDKNGYNKEGFDCNGYDKYGFDHDGFDRYGYDRQQFDKNGFNRAGFDKDGYNVEGYNIFGYNRSGYDKNGFNNKGINKDGINIWGYDFSWYDANGFNPFGFNKSGYDAYGYDKDGFNSKGIDCLGHKKSEFDSDGFHLKTGFNRFGFNRGGYNINGVNENGETFQIESTQYEEIDENDYTIDGIPPKKFDATKYCILSTKIKKNQHLKTDKSQLKVGDIVYHCNLGEAIIKELDGPYCTVIFTRTKATMMFNLFSDYLSVEPSEKIMELNSSFDEKDSNYEIQHLNETISHIKNNYYYKLKLTIDEKWKQEEQSNRKQIINNSGFLSTNTPDYSERADREFNKRISNLIDSPYFARVHKDDDDFYIGKIGTDTIVDWQSPKCRYYYQYQVYVDIPSEKLKLVRDLTVTKSKFFGYIDKYNRDLSDLDFKKYADEHLKKVINANRNKKGIHDIISSIQQNQYEIMIENPSENLLILGCAGSGKTMIMLHRISYLLYNNHSLSASDIFVLSPTKYLSFESSILSKTLNLGDIHKLTVADMWKFILSGYDDKHKIGYNFAKEMIINMSQKDIINKQFIYTEEFIDGFIEKIRKILTKGTHEQHDFIEYYTSELETSKKRFYSLFNNNDLFYKLKEKVEDFIIFCKDAKVHNRNEIGYSLKDVSNMLEKDKSAMRNLKNLYNIKVLIEYFLQNGCFIGHENVKNLNNNLSLEQVVKIIENKFNYLYFITPNLGLVEENFVNTYESKTKAVESILNTLYIHKKITKKSDVINLFDGLRGISSQNVKLYLSLINQTLYANESLPLRIAILEDLQSKGWLFVTHRNEYETPNEKKFLEKIIPVYEALGFDTVTRVIGERFKIHKSIVSIFDFFAAFQNIEDKQKELTLFITAEDRTIIPKVVGFYLGTLDLQEKYMIRHDYEAFIHCAVAVSLYGKLVKNQMLLCIDEFQDLSLIELKTLKNAFFNPVFNFYGDFRQCITLKGDTTESTINNLFSQIKCYQLNENYRNAAEITSYINKIVGVHMVPVGINGLVEKIKYTDYANLKFEQDDRIVYITKDREHLNYSFMSFLGVLEGWKGSQANHLPANVPVALTVQEVKGLEFEVVIVDFAGMTDNEKYVAATRALNRLYIIS